MVDEVKRLCGVMLYNRQSSAFVGCSHGSDLSVVSHGLNTGWDGYV